MKEIDDWNRRKIIRELTQDIISYEIHAKREIETNKVAKKPRDNSQRYLQTRYKKYEDFVGEKYPNPKFEIL